MLGYHSLLEKNQVAIDARNWLETGVMPVLLGVAIKEKFHSAAKDIMTPSGF